MYLSVDMGRRAMMFDVIDLDTGEKLNHVQWANTDTGEYGQFETDENGNIVKSELDGVLRYRVITKKGRIAVRGVGFLTTEVCDECGGHGHNAMNLDGIRKEFPCHRCASTGKRTVYYTGTGQRLVNIHKRNSDCEYGCVIHNPTDPHKDWPTHFREDTGLMERLCAHGVGHPDLDSVNYFKSRGIDLSGHGCDGCCGVVE